MYRRSDGFSCKVRIKNQYIFVFLMGARAVAAAVVAAAWVAAEAVVAVVAWAAVAPGATEMSNVFDTKQCAHNNPKL
jgi:hypothetical protein